MKRKTAVYKGLLNIPVYVEDTSLTSPDYFQISEFPDRLTAGKNLIKLRGNSGNIQINTLLNVEILDYNGDPIYHEIVNYIDEDKSRVIAIYIYEDSSPGDATIILTAIATNVPAEWRNLPNVRWTRSVAVNPLTPNVSEIIFETDPEITINEQIGVQLNRSYITTQFPVYSTGTVTYTSQNNTPIIELSGGVLTPDMKGGTITVATPVNPTPTPTYPINNNTFTAKIKKILSNTTAVLDSSYVVYSSQSRSAHIYQRFNASAYTIQYEAAPTYTPTQNSESVAIVEIKGLEPATGDVSRIKMYTSGKGTVGTWELVNDINLDETEIFVSSTSSINPDQSIGSFTDQLTIDTYWKAHTYVGKTETTAPGMQWTTTDLTNALEVVQAIDITAKNAVSVIQVTGSYAGNFVKNSAYKVTFDAIATRALTSSNRNPKLYVYASGSAFIPTTTDYYNQELAVNLGKRIGQLEVTSNNTRIDDYVFNFKSDYTGTGVLLFVIDAGEWKFADIRTTTDNDAGYTPNYTRIRTEIPTKHKSDNQLAFKIEYYNVAGVKSKLISYVNNKSWQGGNRYIDGDYSMLTGSLYVADSLESGIAISGYKDTGFVRSLGYDGFAAGYPGFLIWSGSALSGSAGTKGGVPYSGVGLELYGDANNYFRYSTIPSELDVHTETFFFGDPASQYISGSNGNLEISSSGFYLTATGDVTASSFLAVGPTGTVLFDSNSEYSDGVNIGRVVYFDRNEYSVTGVNLTTTPQTSSVFETFILPGETRMQVSLMYEFENNSGTAVGTLQGEWYIQSASITGSVGTSTGYDSWSTPIALASGPTTITTINSATIGSIEGGSITKQISTGTALTNHQGYYVRIYMIAFRTTNGNAGDVLKLKGFVYRTSRVAGGAIGPPNQALPEF